MGGGSHALAAGEALFLTGNEEETAKTRQEQHREISAREGVVLDFLEREVPEGWQSWPLDKRRMFWAGSITGELKLVPRDKVCALEVWCEAFNGSQKEMKYTDTTEINGILETAKGWVRSRNGIRCGYCGCNAVLHGAFSRYIACYIWVLHLL